MVESISQKRRDQVVEKLWCALPVSRSWFSSIFTSFSNKIQRKLTEKMSKVLVWVSLHPFLTRSTNIDRKNEQIVNLGVTTSFSNKIQRKLAEKMNKLLSEVSLQSSLVNLECNFELHLSRKDCFRYCWIYGGEILPRERGSAVHNVSAVN